MIAVESVGSFIDGSGGPLYVMSTRPAAGTARAAVLFFPPFGEEMNRSRRMVAVQARALAASGYEVLMVDLFGTGDSAGDFGAATWQQWLTDMGAAWNWLESRGHRQVVAWSLRLGALMAAAVVSERSPGGGAHVFWQPVQDGTQFIDQFLRLRLAADMVSASDSNRETVAGLRSRLARGESLEIAGYDLSASLAAAISGCKLTPAAFAGQCRMAWLDLSTNPSATPSPAATRTAQALRSAGHAVNLEVASGPSFWTSIETVTAPELLQPTVAAVGSLVEGTPQ